ncbi:hypothetical protein [Nocardioides sp. zg-1228]|uniref:hypothetical protein n=1 Tax=Nocardioides sp. zg-1228 TaxID=2763008 RepID=UPI0016433357|nr:hypothetical protein [Nocardioides sp. zg-1228]MBC2933015.1 hypothetical protein [Nocardioides sp. zg-1228]QSF56790.1 hypothetical protein JX575_14445 [Nocardioides sp. zg-1228]
MLVPVLPLRPLWHMGALHPYEQALTLLLAFGPFLLLGLVVWRRRREDDRASARRSEGVDAEGPGPEAPAHPESTTAAADERLS